jgi:hypothetical protein
MNAVVVLISVIVAITYLIERPCGFTVTVALLTMMGDLIFLMGTNL